MPVQVGDECIMAQRKAWSQQEGLIIMSKPIKILSALFWMSLIFSLSSIPGKSFPAETTSFIEIIAHIFLYGVLSFLIFLALISFKEKDNFSGRLIFIAVALSVIYGISDEYHQGYVPGRFVSFADLMFDFLGSVIGAFLIVYFFNIRPNKLLLHICCAGCGAYISQLLKQNYKVILFFYNPNIYPESEYNKRLEETRRIAKKFNLKIIIGEYNRKRWHDLIKGHEQDEEKGKRCLICYRERLRETAKIAKKVKAKYFTTTLTISPHKDAEEINKIGSELAVSYGIKFLNRDYKKHDGFKKSAIMSKKLGLYRQDYCGCEFSRMKN